MMQEEFTLQIDKALIEKGCPIVCLHIMGHVMHVQSLQPASTHRCVSSAFLLSTISQASPAATSLLAEQI